MPAKLDRCVADVKKQGDVDNPWAVCNASLKELIRETNKMIGDLPPIEEDLMVDDIPPIQEHHDPLDIPFGKELPETVSIPGGLSGVSIGAKKKQQEALTVCKPCEMDKLLKKNVLDTMI